MVFHRLADPARHRTRTREQVHDIARGMRQYLLGAPVEPLSFLVTPHAEQEQGGRIYPEAPPGELSNELGACARSVRWGAPAIEVGSTGDDVDLRGIRAALQARRCRCTADRKHHVQLPEDVRHEALIG